MMTKTLWIIDMDDTLFTSYGHVDVYNDENELIDRIDSRDFFWSKQEIEFYGPGKRFCFKYFRCTQDFIDTAKPIGDNWSRILALGAKDGDRHIVTAREHFDDQEGFESFVRSVLKDNDLGINCCVYSEGQKHFPEAKQEVIRRLLKTKRYDRVHMFDDRPDNLDAFLDLRDEFDFTTFHAVHVEGENFCDYHG